MNYVNAFVRVASDTKFKESAVPVAKGGKKTVAVLEYEFISEDPYVYTREEAQFAVYAACQGLPARERTIRRNELWREFFRDIASVHAHFASGKDLWLRTALQRRREGCPRCHGERGTRVFGEPSVN